MSHEIFPWAAATWRQIVSARERLPHALLLAGPAGAGKNAFARALAQRLLCESNPAGEHACGVCEGCRWYLAGNHPDARLVCPEADEESDLSEDKPSDKTAARSTQIRIDQIRALAEFLGVGAVRGGSRVVVITPAEMMNAATANALLKVLEEPPPRTQFILVSDAPRRLLPTVRSRCQTWDFPLPARELALRWLEDAGVAGGASWLDFSGGMPLAARDAAEQGPNVDRFLRDITALPRQDALALAGQWDTWVKAKNADHAVDLALLVAWMQKWVFDLISVKAAGRPCFFTREREALLTLGSRIGLPALFGCYNALSQMRRVATHPLNARLFLDDMLLRYARLLAA